VKIFSYITYILKYILKYIYAYIKNIFELTKEIKKYERTESIIFEYLLLNKIKCQ